MGGAFLCSCTASSCLQALNSLRFYACIVGPFLLVQHLLLGGFQYGVQAPEDGHGEDDVPVLAPHVYIVGVVVGDSPDEI